MCRHTLQLWTCGAWVSSCSSSCQATPPLVSTIAFAWLCQAPMCTHARLLCNSMSWNLQVISPVMAVASTTSTSRLLFLSLLCVRNDSRKQAQSRLLSFGQSWYSLTGRAAWPEPVCCICLCLLLLFALSHARNPRSDPEQALRHSHSELLLK